MNSIKIIANGVYLPETEVNNDELNDRYKLSENWIFKRTGIQKRWYETILNIDEMAINSVKNLLENSGMPKIDVSKIGAIIVATTSTKKIMPGISNQIQKFLGIEKCICIDILAGCSGYVNAFDLARKYICLGEVEYALVVGVEQLSNYLDKEDLNTTIILGDGAGATLIGKGNEDKLYLQNIVSTSKNNEILTCDNYEEKISMNGKAIYKYATTQTVENIKQTLQMANLYIDKVKYIVPHQSNKRILDAIAQKLEISNDKIFSNIQEIGNTFCASIPIALNEMMSQSLIKSGDFVILLGYGGGLNLGSILIEI